mmetsp:Transcript_46533/g.105160  ORF Transcript_46533/g.105160 Transcript_46533/m.105160 type:complete len:223 (+) Transcript_46533:579-1247(+)
MPPFRNPARRSDLSRADTPTRPSVPPTHTPHNEGFLLPPDKKSTRFLFRTATDVCASSAPDVSLGGARGAAGLPRSAEPARKGRLREGQERAARHAPGPRKAGDWPGRGRASAATPGGCERAGACGAGRKFPRTPARLLGAAAAENPNGAGGADRRRGAALLRGAGAQGGARLGGRVARRGGAAAARAGREGRKRRQGRQSHPAPPQGPSGRRELARGRNRH